MNNLKETIEVVLKKMKKHRSLYEQNEMAVSRATIFPSAGPEVFPTHFSCLAL